MARHPPRARNVGKPRQHHSETQAWLRGSLGPDRRGLGVAQCQAITLPLPPKSFSRWHLRKEKPSLQNRCGQRGPGMVHPESRGFPCDQTVSVDPSLRSGRCGCQDGWGMKLSEVPPKSPSEKHRQRPSVRPGFSVWVIRTTGSHFCLETQERHVLPLWLGDFN